MLGVYRSYEPFEALGLILHQPQFVGACSKAELEEALWGLLGELEGTRDKVDSQKTLCDASQPSNIGALHAECKGFSHDCIFERPAKQFTVCSIWPSTPCGLCLSRSCPSQCFSLSCQSSAACWMSTWHCLSPTEAAGMLTPSPGTHQSGMPTPGYLSSSNCHNATAEPDTQLGRLATSKDLAR